MTPNISIINASHVMLDSSLKAMLPAFQKYVDHYVGPAWTVSADLHFVPWGAKADPHHWWILINNHSDVDGALGYHDTQPNGLPYARIFAGDDLKYGASVPVTITHELAEMLGDPGASATVQVGFRFYARELCDAVEADEQAIAIDGVPCSNFVLPPYFRRGSAGPWDYQKNLAGPVPALTPGGYMAFEVGGVWHQVTARLADGSLSRRSLRTGRCARRAS